MRTRAKKDLGAWFCARFWAAAALLRRHHFADPKPIPARAAVGTAVFMAAIAIALVVSKWKLGKIAPMMWISAILVIGFGALPSGSIGDVYPDQADDHLSCLRNLLLGGWLRGKALLKYLLEYAFEGVSDAGWLKLSRNWGIFFLAMAGINEIIRAATIGFQFDSWLTLKVWGVTALSSVHLSAKSRC